MAAGKVRPDKLILPINLRQDGPAGCAPPGASVFAEPEDSRCQPSCQ